MACKQCGKCCTQFSIVYPNNDEQAEFLRARGFKAWQSNDKFTQWVLRTRCPHLTQENKCDIYEGRPLACQVFPVTLMYQKIGLDPDKAVPKGCGYKFNEETQTYE